MALVVPSENAAVSVSLTVRVGGVSEDRVSGRVPVRWTDRITLPDESVTVRVTSTDGDRHRPGAAVACRPGRGRVVHVLPAPRSSSRRDGWLPAGSDRTRSLW